MWVLEQRLLLVEGFVVLLFLMLLLLLLLLLQRIVFRLMCFHWRLWAVVEIRLLMWIVVVFHQLLVLQLLLQFQLWFRPFLISSVQV